MAKTYKAAATIVTTGNVVYKVGDIVEIQALGSGERGARTVKAMLRDKQLVIAGVQYQEEAPAKTIKVGTETDEETGETRPKITSEEPPPPPPTAAGLFSLDPNSLQSQSLQQLQVLVAERDANITPPQSEEAARAILTKDWVG